MSLFNVLKSPVASATGVGAGVMLTPEESEASFLGQLAKTADHMSLTRAKHMEEQGKSALYIKLKTNWEKGKDGKWRFEVPDPTKITGVLPRNYGLGGVENLRDVIPDHPGIAAYGDDFAKTFVARDQLRPGVMANVDRLGTINLDLDQMHLHDYDPLSALLHEVQHVIQKKEGFTRGASGQSKDYKKIYGEVEARNVQKRMNLTPEQRRKTLARSTQDIPYEDIIAPKNRFLPRSYLRVKNNKHTPKERKQSLGDMLSLIGSIHPLIDAGLVYNEFLNMEPKTPANRRRK